MVSYSLPFLIFNIYSLHRHRHASRANLTSTMKVLVVLVHMLTIVLLLYQKYNSLAWSRSIEKRWQIRNQMAL